MSWLLLILILSIYGLTMKFKYAIFGGDSITKEISCLFTQTQKALPITPYKLVYDIADILYSDIIKNNQTHA